VLLLYADSVGRTDRHDEINSRFAQRFSNAPKNKYIAKFQFKDTEIPARSYNTVPFVPNTTRTLNNVQHNVDILMTQPILQKFHIKKIILKINHRQREVRNLEQISFSILAACVWRHCSNCFEITFHF
jgi:hypothetical protein